MSYNLTKFLNQYKESTHGIFMSTRTERAIHLIRRITTPSSQLGTKTSTPLNSKVQNAASSPNIGRNLDIPTDAYVQLLDKQYHLNTLMAKMPFDLRTGSENNEELGDLNELVRLIAYKETYIVKTLKALPPEDRWRVDRAVTKAALRASVSDLEFFHFYLAVQRALYLGEVWSRLYFMANTDTLKAAYLLEDVFKVHERIFNTSENFSRWTYAMRGTSSDPYWNFERFIRHVNGPSASAGKDLSYKIYRPKSPDFPNFTVNDFPGPGIVVNGINSPLFPKGHLAKRFLGSQTDIPNNTSPTLSSDWAYRNLLVSSEGDLGYIRLGLFRGPVVIYNPRKMIINGQPHGLVAAYNDHFQNRFQRSAYLIRGSIIERFFDNPLKDFGENHILNPSPKKIKELGKHIIKIESVRTLAGLDKGARKYSETEVGSVDLHLQIKNCALYGFAMLDLLLEGFRLHNLGFFYDRAKDDWYLDEYRALRELVRWHNVTSEKAALDDSKEVLDGPVLFPFTLLQHRISPEMLEQCGFVTSNGVIYRDKPTGDSMLFPDGPPEIASEEIESRSNTKWKDALGKEGVDAWYKFHSRAEETGANLLMVDPIYKGIGQEYIKSRLQQ